MHFRIFVDIVQVYGQGRGLPEQQNKRTYYTVIQSNMNRRQKRIYRAVML